MSTPTTGQRRDIRGLLGRMFVGRPPKKPPGRVHLTLTLLGFPVWSSVMVVTWGAMPPLLTLAFLSIGLGGVMGTLGSLAEYHRWRGRRPGWLLRLATGLLSGGSLALFLAHMVLTGLQTGQWGWLWWATFVLGLTTVILVAGYFYGPGGGSDPEGDPSAGRGPRN